MKNIIVRKNKRGDIISLWLVMLTLVMCVTSIMVYVNVQNKINISLATPEKVLKLEEEKQIFEANERIVFSKTYKEISISDLEKLKNKFCSEMFNYSKFITHDYFDGQKKFEDSFWNSLEWLNLCKSIYTIEDINNKIKVSRKEVKKQFKVSSDVITSISFSNKIKYSFSHSFEIDK